MPNMPVIIKKGSFWPIYQLLILSASTNNPVSKFPASGDQCINVFRDWILVGSHDLEHMVHSISILDDQLSLPTISFHVSHSQSMHIALLNINTFVPVIELSHDMNSSHLVLLTLITTAASACMATTPPPASATEDTLERQFILQGLCLEESGTTRCCGLALASGVMATPNAATVA
ncbi:uncharacterized protein ARMOST_12276 [Armillaria ostoyae]|uniref:Uncharacterized protein n=1 Tax=Armillaria ostoyae TaxID=47428 RepID=A0A284RJI4_ARMOS|nr:uncharacterized protein ARMOST_12276 [Armillaria ostoyae]